MLTHPWQVGKNISTALPPCILIPYACSFILYSTVGKHISAALPPYILYSLCLFYLFYKYVTSLRKGPTSITGMIMKTSNIWVQF